MAKNGTVESEVKRSKPLVIKTNADLREMLISTIGQVQDGSIDYRQAQAISGLTTKILQSARLDLDIMRFRAQGGEASDSVLKLTK